MMKKFNNIRLWKKQLLSFLLIMLIPYGVCVMLATKVNTITLQNATDQAHQAVYRMGVRMERLLSGVMGVSESIRKNMNILTLVTDTYDSLFAQIQASWEKGDLYAYITGHADVIGSVLFFVDSHNVLNTGYVKNTPPYIRSTQWYQDAMAQSPALSWAYAENDSFARFRMKDLAFCSSVMFRDRSIGVLCVYVNHNALRDIIMEEEFEAILCGADGRIVAARNEALLDQNIDTLGIRLESDDVTQHIRLDRQDYSVISKSLAIADTQGYLRVIALYSRDTILSQTRRITWISYGVIALSIPVSALIIIFLTQLITSRFVRISANIRRVARGELDFEPKVDGADEIGHLSSDLAFMVESLRNLIHENYTIKLQKQRLENYQQEIQLQVLGSQINPHFFFNAMESVRMKAVLLGQKEVAEDIKLLGSFMRKSLYVHSEAITLADELDFIENYLRIQKTRFSEHFSYRIDLGLDTQKQKILPFLLQPLVENAFRHGVEKSDKTGLYVMITAFPENGVLVIRVADNGAGIDGPLLEKLKLELADPADQAPQAHIGLSNVSQRVRFCYGKGYGLDIQSAAGRGTVVTLRIPLTCGGEEDRL